MQRPRRHRPRAVASRGGRESFLPRPAERIAGKRYGTRPDLPAQSAARDRPPRPRPTGLPRRRAAPHPLERLAEVVQPPGRLDVSLATLPSRASSRICSSCAPARGRPRIRCCSHAGRSPEITTPASAAQTHAGRSPRDRSEEEEGDAGVRRRCRREPGHERHEHDPGRKSGRGGRQLARARTRRRAGASAAA